MTRYKCLVFALIAAASSRSVGFAQVQTATNAAHPQMVERPWSLYYATSHGQTNVVAMLLKLRVDVNEVGRDGSRALDIACLKGNAAIARILLDYGADPNLRNPSGGTPLHDAALIGNAELIELLLERGASLAARDSESASTPLQYAASFGRAEAVTVLVRHGADISLKNKKGMTALDLAERGGYQDIVRILQPANGRRPHAAGGKDN